VLGQKTGTSDSEPRKGRTCRERPDGPGLKGGIDSTTFSCMQDAKGERYGGRHRGQGQRPELVRIPPRRCKVGKILPRIWVEELRKGVKPTQSSMRKKAPCPSRTGERGIKKAQCVPGAQIAGQRDRRERLVRGELLRTAPNNLQTRISSDGPTRERSWKRRSATEKVFLGRSEEER